MMSKFLNDVTFAKVVCWVLCVTVFVLFWLLFLSIIPATDDRIVITMLVAAAAAFSAAIAYD